MTTTLNFGPHGLSQAMLAPTLDDQAAMTIWVTGEPEHDRPCHHAANNQNPPKSRRPQFTMPSGLARQWAWHESDGMVRSYRSIRPFVPSQDTPSANCLSEHINPSPTLLTLLLTNLKQSIYPATPKAQVIRWQNAMCAKMNGLCGASFMCPRSARKPMPSPFSSSSRSHSRPAPATEPSPRTGRLWYGLVLVGLTSFATILGNHFWSLLASLGS